MVMLIKFNLFKPFLYLLSPCLQLFFWWPLCLVVVLILQLVREVSRDFYPLMMNNIPIRMVEVYAQSPARFLEIGDGVNRVLADGALNPHIDGTWPLKDAAAAHERVESGEQIGNVIIEV